MYIFIVLVVFIALFACSIAPGFKLAHKGEAVLYWGKRDFVVSFVAAGAVMFSLFSLIMCIAEPDDAGTRVFLVSLLITCPLLIYSFKRSHAANLRDSQKTILVVLSKLAIASFILIGAFVISSIMATPDKKSSNKNSSNNSRSLIFQFLFATLIVYASKISFAEVKKLIRENPLENKPNQIESNSH